MRIIKVPEKAEGQDTIGFVQKLLIHLFGQENFPTAPPIEIAHRSPTQRRGDRSSAHPRPLVVKFLRLQDKIKTLRLARQKGTLMLENTRIHFFPDFSAEVLNQRRAFDPIKKKLQEMNVQYALLYPAVLRVNIGDVPRMFHSHGEAENFLKEVMQQHSPM
ncbi:hypothetical protein WMY93_004514 [Mugilogobius chulae]